MIQQRKRPAIRVGPRLAGLPPDEPVAPTAPAKRPGRPPKYGVAMTLAERKAESRANQKTKLEDRERRTLIAKLMKIYRQQQSSIVHDSLRPKAVEERQRSARAQQRQYLAELERLSLPELQVA